MPCPSVEHAPQSLEGWQAWEVACRAVHVVSNGTQARLVLNHADAAIQAQALGYNTRVMAELIPFIAGGIAQAGQEAGHGGTGTELSPQDPDH